MASSSASVCGVLTYSVQSHGCGNGQSSSNGPLAFRERCNLTHTPYLRQYMRLSPLIRSSSASVCGELTYSVQSHGCGNGQSPSNGPLAFRERCNLTHTPYLRQYMRLSPLIF